MEKKSGTYEVKEGTDYITITLDGVVYKGVLMEMTDEAENPVFCFFGCRRQRGNSLGRKIYLKGVKRYGKVNDQQKKKKEGTIAPEIYGHFSEHLGRCIYEGLYMGENSEIPNVNGMRTDVVEALKEIKIPVLRWPGGCFCG